MFRKKFQSVLVLVLSLVMVGVLAGCGGGGNKTEQGANNNAKTITIAGSTSVQPLSDELTAKFMEEHPGVTIHVQGGGSSAGVKSALEGAAEIGAASRELKESEKGQGLVEHKIAVDGIAIVSNAKNKAVESLTIEQVRKIFAGEITNWKEVGGPNAKINVVSREDGSGTRGAFDEMVMAYKDEAGEEKTAELVGEAAIQNSNGAVRTTVAQDENAIGYLSLGYLNEQVNPLKIDNVEPTDENIKAGSYKIARPFLYLTKGEPEGLAKDYIDFVLNEGQEIVKAGYITVK